MTSVSPCATLCHFRPPHRPPLILLRPLAVVLAPSPLPPLLLPLCASLLRSDYCLLVAVPRASEAEQVEADLAKVQGKDGWKGNFRVLCYSAADVSVANGWLT